ncbi:trans-sialidase, putative, partial [Trypanosoma cruzi]
LKYYYLRSGRLWGPPTTRPAARWESRGWVEWQDKIKNYLASIGSLTLKVVFFPKIHTAEKYHKEMYSSYQDIHIKLASSPAIILFTSPYDSGERGSRKRKENNNKPILFYRATCGSPWLSDDGHPGASNMVRPVPALGLKAALSAGRRPRLLAALVLLRHRLVQARHHTTTRQRHILQEHAEVVVVAHGKRHRAGCQALRL